MEDKRERCYSKVAHEDYFLIRLWKRWPICMCTRLSLCILYVSTSVLYNLTLKRMEICQILSQGWSFFWRACFVCLFVSCFALLYYLMCWFVFIGSSTRFWFSSCHFVDHMFERHMTYQSMPTRFNFQMKNGLFQIKRSSSSAVSVYSQIWFLGFVGFVQVSIINPILCIKCWVWVHLLL